MATKTEEAHVEETHIADGGEDLAIITTENVSTPHTSVSPESTIASIASVDDCRTHADI